MARSTGNFKSCRITVLIKESITAGACCCMPVDFVCVCALFFPGSGEDCRTGKKNGEEGEGGEERQREREREMQRGEERRKYAIDSVLKPPTNNSH